MNNFANGSAPIIGHIEYRTKEGNLKQEPVRTQFWGDMIAPTYRNMESALKGRGIAFCGEPKYIPVVSMGKRACTYRYTKTAGLATCT